MSISSPDNKQMLIQLLGSHPLLQRNPQQFHQTLHYHMERIHKGRFHFNNDLMLMNKEIIRIFSQISLQMSQQKTAPSLKIGKPVSRSNLIEKRLKERQQHFENNIQVTKPTEIDFRDKTDTIPTRRSDTMLEERQQELKKIMNNYQPPPEASKWISGEDGVTNLNIDHDTPVAVESIPLSTNKIEKHVTFQIEEQVKQEDPKQEDTADTFLKRLKKPNIEELLLKMLQNQEKILMYLQPTTNS